MNYWDRISEMQKDNVWKRFRMLRFVTDLDLYDKSVLEIGVGLGTIGAALRAVFLGTCKYACTDVSEKNCEYVKKAFGLDSYHADICKLPFYDKTFDFAFLFDVLEHVNPKDRTKGYAELSRVLKPFANVVLNIPLEESCHEEEEYGFSDKDLYKCLSSLGMTIDKYETYTVKLPNEYRRYAWVVGVR